jgi:hypothetical protein
VRRDEHFAVDGQPVDVGHHYAFGQDPFGLVHDMFGGTFHDAIVFFLGAKVCKKNDMATSSRLFVNDCPLFDIFLSVLPGVFMSNVFRR